MNLKAYFREHQILADGAMGTYCGELFPADRRSPELFNTSHPERILAIHREYLRAGAQLLRTNSFASNLETLSRGHAEPGVSREAMLRQLADNVQAAHKLAQQAIREVGIPEIFIAGDIGPIPARSMEEPEELLEEYFAIADAHLAAGAGIVWFETFSDFTYLLPVAEYLKKKKSDIFLMASFCLNKYGYTSAGIRAQSVLEQAASSQVLDGVGFNCGIGSTHMYQILKKLDLKDLVVSVMPNSGYPGILRDRAN